MMIWVDQADLLKSVNKWLEKSPNLFPNQLRFFLREPNAELSCYQRTKSLKAMHRNHQTHLEQIQPRVGSQA
ncbi:hypothetical protein [Vibrio sp. 2-2(8)]|uniref:hypothetical protein n=1 Tax=Vibrio sp. 2-2(8) TaxID=2591014 RepID=UPI001481E26C|nr:hypothetical protein [Vibrio sp. 2-2(8)]